MAELSVISLKNRRNSLHPWIFNRMVEHPRRRTPPGTLAEIHDREGNFIGRGFYHPDQTIALRLLTENAAEQLDEAFFENRLRRAKELREDVLRLGEVTDSYRLVHAECDGLSGLVIDKFADVLVVEPYCAGYLNIIPWIAESLRRIYPGCRVAVRPDARTEAREGVSYAGAARDYPSPSRVDIRENKLRLRVNFQTGHKTGFFLDQRDNRAAVANLAAGRDVLDLCCYSGGFAISAMLGGAKSCVAVDLDEEALSTARSNADFNKVKVEFRHQNVFDTMRGLIAKKEAYDLVVLDPAKLAGVKDEIPRAMKTYGDLNRLAMQVVRPGGVLVTCSCSGLIERETFESIVRHSAAEAAVTLQIFRVSGAACDHPESSEFPEGRYLKAIFSRVQPSGRPPFIATRGPMRQEDEPI